MAEGDGYGQMRPERASSEYNAAEFLVERKIAELDTIKIVKVQAVDTEAKTVQVLPIVQQVDGNNQVTDQGTIYGVPYMRWQYGSNAVLADPAVDDIGLLLCSDRDISAVKETQDVAPPGSERQYHRSDGVYLGGIFNDDPDQYVKFTDTGLELHDKNSNSLVSSSTGWLFTGKVTFATDVVMQAGLGLQGDITDDGGGTYGGNFHTSGTITGDTDVKSGTISLKTHRTSGVTTGGGISGVPVP